MTIQEITIAVIIHLIIPIIGVVLFLRLIVKMNSENIVAAPILEYFIIFATYGTLLIIILTSLFWKWSGLASLGFMYLILGAPLAMGIIAYIQSKNRNISKYHDWAFQFCLFYYIIAPALFFVEYLMEPEWIH